MKKLGFLLTAVIITVFGAKVMAQDGSGTAPSIGSTHQYWVNGTYGSPSAGAGDTYYTWWISTNAADLTVATTLTTHFSRTGGAAYNSQTKGDAGGTGIEIQWTSVADVSQIYYLVVQETDVDGTACSNLKAMAIQPVNNFELLFVALDSEGETSDGASSCAPDIALSATGTSITYNYGVGEYLFKLTATGLYSDWSFDNAWDNVLGDASETLEYQVGGTDPGSWTEITTSTIPVSANVNGTEDVYIRVSVDNGNTGGTAEEGLTEQTMELTISNVKDAGDNAAVVSNKAGDDITTGAAQTQTVKARPATTGIGTDN